MIRLKKDFPKQLIFGENVYDIVFCRKIPDEPEDTLGLFDPSEQRIYIRLNQTPVERFKTLAHEACHAMCYEFGIPEKHKIIELLEEPILKFLIDNGLVL